MQQTEHMAGHVGAGLGRTRENAAAFATAATLGTEGREGLNAKRLGDLEAKLTALNDCSESLRGIAHDARNMVTALGLYCELLEEPGVLSAPFAHYGSELRLVATASRRLVEKLVSLDLRQGGQTTYSGQVLPEREAGEPAELIKERRWELLPAQPIENLAADLLANRNLLAALAGPSVALTVDAQGGARPVALTSEDLTRVLVNLVKNAAEAMNSHGRVQISLQEAGDEPWMKLTVEDSGPGIPQDSLEKIFETGHTTRSGDRSWPVTHRGLGLSITRSILESAGGRIHAANRPLAGARFEIELPVRTR
jgi:signal transduction histidine kinase